MHITVLELNEDKVRISLPGQGHTFMNALKSEILKDLEVDVANYLIEFQFSDPVLTVTTHDKKDPVRPIVDACKRLSGQCDEILDSIKDVVSPPRIERPPRKVIKEPAGDSEEKTEEGTEEEKKEETQSYKKDGTTDKKETTAKKTTKSKKGAKEKKETTNKTETDEKKE